MSKARHSSQTPATQWLQRRNIAHTVHIYDYVDHGGARHAAQVLGLDIHSVAKTLIMEDERAKPMVIIMHGDREVSLKNLARQVGVKKVAPCSPATAERHSGYQVGGTSPFGTRKVMPVWVEASLLELDTIHINGGRRGMLLSLSPRALDAALEAVPIHVAL